MPKSRQYLLLLTIILTLAAFLRLAMLPSIPPGLYPDEAMNGNNAVEALATGNFKVFYPENFGREGLFINIQALSLFLFGNQPWALRLPSAIFGILTVLGVYFLTKELFPKNHELRIKNYGVALLSAFLLATSFWHLNFSRTGFRAITAPFFLTWALYLFLLALNKFKIRNSKFEIPKESKLPTGQANPKFQILNSKFFAFLGGLVYGLGFHTYIAYRATPLLFLAFIPYFRKYKNFWIVFSIFAIATIITAAPLGIYFLKNPQDFLGRTSQISIFSQPNPALSLLANLAKTIGMFFVVGDFNPRHNYPGSPELFFPIAILFAIGIILSFRHKSLAYRLPLAWLMVATIPVVISSEALPHALRSILMAPAVFILSGIGAGWVIEKFKPHKIITAIVLMALVIQVHYAYFVRWANDPRVKDAFDYKDTQAAKLINSLPQSTPKYIGVDTQDFIHLQTLFFLTDSYLPERRARRNIFYVEPEELKNVPAGSFKIDLK